ncbi:DUF418 domain-containing protein [Haloferula rosea]|uniref:DUF418 domain-containing protein n=1 Tax=Haloferula rosea TaxID=490093 RepID=A0A934R9S9_9BACT|nr:DUF418 domain-containing protein [Haloferula rosea]MBK1827017.1 DUF418 domain-containing protein [Haloferula rosea]
MDILRGMAVLGILLMNIQSFGLVQAAYENPFHAGPLDPVDHAAWSLTHYLVSGRAISTFAMLFGAGIILSTRREDEAGLSSAPKFYKRYAILAGIGLLHAYFLWFGDILFSYAITGFIVYLMRRIRVWLQVAIGLVSILGSILFNTFLFEFLGQFPDSADYLDELWYPGPEAIQAEIAAVTGPWQGWFLHNAKTAAVLQFFALPFGLAQFCGGLMLIGMALLRTGFFEMKWAPIHYLTGALTGILTGFLLTRSPASIAAINDGHHSAWAYLLGECSAPLMAFGFMCLVIRLLQKQHPPRWLASFAPAGRMALTLYLSQSLIGYLLFTGAGLGLFEKLGHAELLVLALAIFGLQMAFAHLWLKRFKLGPLEWLWRRMSYGKLRTA